MSSYQQLILKDREIILVGLKPKHSYQLIATEIGRSKATISREVHHNGGVATYSAVQAQHNYERRRLNSRQPRILTNCKLRHFVIERLIHRPRKVLGWKSPAEVFFGQSLHLI